jgi:Holliday junction resolvase RusA-like endonuclease
MPEIKLQLIGKVPAVKNRRHVGKNGATYFDQKGIKGYLDALAWQIAPEIRNLQLEHPDVTYRFCIPEDSKYSRAWASDWDNRVVTLSDLLVRYGVFRDDCFKYHNGRKVVEPAVRLPKGEVERTEVIIRYGE